MLSQSMIAVHANIYIYTVYIYILVCLFLYPHLRVPYIFGTKTLVPNIYGTGRRSFSLISKVLGGQRKAKKWMQSLPWQKCTASQIPIFFSTAREQQCDSLIKHAVSWSAWKLSSMTLWPCANKSHFNKETLLAQGIKTKNPKHIRILPPFLPQKLKAWRFFTQNC